ncbi:MAG: hypothetical protein HY445_00865 [Candidatus Niyogibacteria bacterium]|nr:hypothetical protein [Candidatus Niyogibacteria bacterium]
MAKEQKTTLNDLARSIAKGFEKTVSDIEQLGNKLDHTDARIARIETDIKEMSGNIVYKSEFEDLEARVKYVESKLNIVSGK